MLGHLVSNGHLADSTPRLGPAIAPAVPQGRTIHHPSGWFGRLIAHLLQRR